MCDITHSVCLRPTCIPALAPPSPLPTRLCFAVAHACCPSMYVPRHGSCCGAHAIDMAVGMGIFYNVCKGICSPAFCHALLPLAGKNNGWVACGTIFGESTPCILVPRGKVQRGPCPWDSFCRTYATCFCVAPFPCKFCRG